MGEYYSHRHPTIGYMDQYLQKFHARVQGFRELRETRKDRPDAKEAHRELVPTQLEVRQARLEEYIESSAIQRNRLAGEDRQEGAQVIHKVLSHAELNFPKMYLLSHYSSQIQDFVRLPQYLTEITEALHKPTKNT